MDNLKTRMIADGSKTSMQFKSIALKGLFVMGFFYTLYFARALILPLTLAFLLNLLLRPLVRSLKRLGMPEFVGAALVIVALLGSLGYGAVKLSKPAAEWMDKAPESLQQIESRAGFLRKPLESLNRAAEEFKKITSMGKENKPEVEIRHPGLPDTILAGTGDVIAKGAVMFIFLYFLLGSGDLFVRKIVRLFPRLNRKKEVVKITREVEHQVSRYLFTITVINFSLGVAMSAGMYLIQMPNPVLWGVMAGFLVFLPYVGPFIGIGIVTVVAFLTFDSPGRIALAPAIYLTLETIQGQVVSPMVLGLRFALNPIAIFIWLIFWGWIWGIIGALLAFPMLTVFKILCDHIEPLAPVGELLGR